MCRRTSAEAVPACWRRRLRCPYVSAMRALLPLLFALCACRPSDGNSKSTPTRGATTSAAAQPVSDSARESALLERADKARIHGDTAAKVWLVEISDFECPFCKRWHDQTYPALVRNYVQTGKVRMAYVNF